jgi:hypothetical protein
LERSQEQAEQRQLVRSLHQTLTDDLLSSRFPSRLGEQTGEAQSDSPSESTGIAAGEQPDSGGGSSNADMPSGLGQSNLSLESGAPNDVTSADGATNSSTSLPLDPRRGQASLALLNPILMTDWLQPGPIFVGTSDTLLVDLVPAALPGQRVPPTVEPSLETASIPDTLRRVVYAFSSPASALTQDRPAGLVRCELTVQQLLAVQQGLGAQPDLLSFLRPRMPDIGPAAESAPSPTPDQQRVPSASSGAATSNGTATRTDTAASAAESLDPLSSDAMLSPSGNSLADLSQQIDYAPELVMFTLRYYDGSSWQSAWDSRRQKGQQPVAVEVRFQLRSDLPQAPTADESTDGLPSSGTAEVLEALNEPSSSEPLDDELRSALTKPPEDHRYVIYLRDTPHDDRDNGASPTTGEPTIGLEQSSEEGGSL